MISLLFYSQLEPVSTDVSTDATSDHTSGHNNATLKITSPITTSTPPTIATPTEGLFPLNMPKGTSLSKGKVVTKFYKRYWKGEEPIIEKAGRTPRTLTPFEQSGNNIMITIKTTQSYHTKRVQVLLDTWISAVNASNVFLVTDGDDEEYEKKARDIGKIASIYTISCVHIHYNRSKLC